jgi:hypothetical protein
MIFSDSFLHHGKIGTADKQDHVVEAALAKSVTRLSGGAPAGLFA